MQKHQEKELKRLGFLSLTGLFEIRAQEYLETLPSGEHSGVNKFLKGLGEAQGSRFPAAAPGAMGSWPVPATGAGAHDAELRPAPTGPSWHHTTLLFCPVLGAEAKDTQPSPCPPGPRLCCSSFTLTPHIFSVLGSGA